jgi:hypothetical protein
MLGNVTNTSELTRNSVVSSLGLIISAAILGVAMVYSVATFTKSQQRINVKGVAERMLKADRAIWRGAINVRNPSYEKATLKLAADREAVFAFVREAGFDSTDIVFLMPNVYPQYKILANGMTSGEIDHYVADQTVEVVTGALERIPKLMTAGEAMIKKGISFVPWQPEYLLSGIETIKVEMLAAASVNARLRAERLATEGGSKAGKLVSARQGVFQISAPFATEDDGYGTYDTRTIEKRVRIVVTNEYALE